jgi:hypothetical protein
MGQSVQALDCTVANRPLGQSVHLLRLYVSAYFPAAHGVQSSALKVPENCPARQYTQKL